MLRPTWLQQSRSRPFSSKPSADQKTTSKSVERLSPLLITDRTGRRRAARQLLIRDFGFARPTNYFTRAPRSRTFSQWPAISMRDRSVLRRVVEPTGPLNSRLAGTIEAPGRAL